MIFTKVPKAGDIKTRLTEERGGILTKEEAQQVYEASLLDVIDACIASNSGDVYICHNLAGDRAYLLELLQDLTEPQAIKGITADKGGSFDQCMQYAADYILKNGAPDRLADSVLVVGGDLPELQPENIQKAVRKMNMLAASPHGLAAAKKDMRIQDQPVGAALVQAACQEGGFSMVGYTCNTPFDFGGVFYNQDGITALDMLVQKAAAKNIPMGIVDMVPDLDIPVDLASLIPVIKALQLAHKYDPLVTAPRRTISVLEELGLESTAAPPQR